MKKLTALLLAVVLVLALTACGAAEETDRLTQIKEAGKLVIATEGDWSPWTYHDPETNELTGFDVEIGKALAEHLGVEAEFQETQWDSILAGVESGRFDIACNGVDYTEARAESYAFSNPYVYTEIVLVVRGDNEDITCFEDLQGKTTANTASSTYAAIGEEYGATVTPVDSLTETIELTISGRIDATINAKGTIEDYLSANPDANLKIVDVLPGDPVAFPMQKSSSTDTLVAAINDALDEMRADGTLAALSEKYFGADLTNSAE